MKNLIENWRSERSSPMHEYNSLQRQVDRFMDGFPTLSSPNLEYRRDVGFWPACDFEEGDSAYLISLDIPGMTEDQLSVELCGSTLTISGEQKEESGKTEGARKYSERYHGRFERSFVLPEATDTDKLEAEYRAGVLRIAVPKVEAVKSRKVHIGENSKGGLLAKYIGKNEQKQEHRQVERAA